MMRLILACILCCFGCSTVDDVPMGGMAERVVLPSTSASVLPGTLVAVPTANQLGFDGDIVFDGCPVDADPTKDYEGCPNEDTAPALVMEWSEKLGADPKRMSCGWDRCGDSGGFVCQDGGGFLCVWQRGTLYFQCGSNGCVSGGSSCYRCPVKW
jgi:hypothetical protein